MLYPIHTSQPASGFNLHDALLEQPLATTRLDDRLLSGLGKFGKRLGGKRAS